MLLLKIASSEDSTRVGKVPSTASQESVGGSRYAHAAAGAIGERGDRRDEQKQARGRDRRGT
jgi:hypothetical protein